MTGIAIDEHAVVERKALEALAVAHHAALVVGARGVVVPRHRREPGARELLEVGEI
jgi:hypothetical protein